MENIRYWLTSIGYDTIVSNIDLRGERFSQWLGEQGEFSLDDQLFIAIQFLFLGKSVARNKVNKLLPKELLELLTKHELIIDSPGATQLRLKGLRLNVLNGLYIFAQMPSVNQAIYFGEDTSALHRNLPAIAMNRALDLCCGPGSQALNISQRCEHVDAFDINPFAISIAKINALINGMEHKTSFVLNDVFALDGTTHRYDYICMNPPLIPVVPGTELPLVAGGGEDGFELTRNIIPKLPGLLSEKGVFRSLGLAYCRSGTPLLLNELEELAKFQNLTITWNTVAKIDISENSDTFHKLALTCQSYTGGDYEDITLTLKDYFLSKDITSMCSYYLSIRPEENSGLIFNDMFDFSSNNCWGFL